jgi:hypothetical protein
MINRLQKQYAQNDDVGVVFVYFNYKEPRSASEILGSLLQQLASRETAVSTPIRDVWKAHNVKKTRPTAREFLTLLQNEAKKFTKLFVVMDALDECPETYENRDCRNTLLRSIICELGPAPRVLATGRSHIKDIKEVFPDARVIEIRGTEEDIRKLVNSRIDVERSLKYYVAKNPKLRKRVTDEIAKKVGGM